MTEHIHEANIIDEPRPYRGPVASPDFSEPRAHGNIEVTERCHCGFHRRVNVNQWFREEGPWMPGPR